VRTLSTFSLALAGCSDEVIQRNMARVLTELRVMGAWHFALMAPALLDAVTKIIRASDQGGVVKAIHEFVCRVRDDPEFARKLITKHHSPVSYSNLAGVEQDGDVFGSVAQKEAYERLCAPTQHDDLAVQLLQVSAAQIAKVNVCMSSDLLQGEQAECKGKRGDNITDERFFGMLDWRNTIQRTMSQLRKDALAQWETNNTMAWLEAMGEKAADKVVAKFAMTSVTDATMAKNKAEQGAADSKRRRDAAAAIESQEQNQAIKASACSLPAGVERWTAANFDSKFAELQGSAQQKRDVMKQQWAFLKGWAERAKQRMGAAPGAAAGVDKWKDALRGKLQDGGLMEAIEGIIAQAAQREGVDRRTEVLGAVLTDLPPAPPVSDAVIQASLQKIASLENYDVRSKKHREDEEFHRLMSPEQYSTWFRAQLQLPKAKRRQCVGKRTALGTFKGKLFESLKARRGRPAAGDAGGE
jgi:hypothetical protein